MAEKKNQPIIIIKKVKKRMGEAHHGGSWKVAFADFMTAMMAFFLVMWLISQSEEVKKEIADYFSTPSVVEYNFKNYGALLTLEKLFLDLVNDPLKFFESFIRPKDFTPDIMNLGSQKVVENYIVEKLRDFSKNIRSDAHSLSFDIPDYHLFVSGTAKTNKNFVSVMVKIQALSSGLKDSDIHIDSKIHIESFRSYGISQEEKVLKLEEIAEERMIVISKLLEKTLEHPSVEIYGKASILDFGNEQEKEIKDLKHPHAGLIVITIKKRQQVKKIVIDEIPEPSPLPPSEEKEIFQAPQENLLPPPVFSKREQEEISYNPKIHEDEKEEPSQEEQQVDLETLKKRSLRNREQKMNLEETRFDPFSDPFTNPLNDIDIKEKN